MINYMGDYMVITCLNKEHELPRMSHELSLIKNYMRNYMGNYMVITCLNKEHELKYEREQENNYM